MSKRSSIEKYEKIINEKDASQMRHCDCASLHQTTALVQNHSK